MAKIHIDRLKDKYGFKTDKVTGKRLSGLVIEIIANNQKNISTRLGKLNQSHWTEQVNKIKTSRKILVPNFTTVLPSRSVFFTKAAEKGELITDTLRDRLTKNLRDSLKVFTPVTKEPAFVRRRGEKVGRINPKLINEFEKSIEKTFKNYTKKDPKLGMPSNIHNIAVTEYRGASNLIKEEYANKFEEKNKDKIELSKQWIHNAMLSKEPRRGHRFIDSAIVKKKEKFKVPTYIKKGKRWFRTGKFVMMDRPHDPSAPLNEIVGCNCDVQYIIIPKS